MEKNSRIKDVFVVGFATFAIFFGAGNLIFPPYLGVLAGDNWMQAMIGFLVTDPVLPVLGLLAVAMVGSSAEDLGKRVSPKFATLIGTIAILAIGPFFCVPRTAATTHEVTVSQLPFDVPLVVTSVVFFGITLLMALNQNGVIDKIGKVLTPALLIILLTAIVTAVINPVGVIQSIPKDNFFLTGFTEGYQTMDALGAALIAGIVCTDLNAKGYKTQKDRLKMMFGIGAIAFVLLAIVYGGFTYVGATVGQYYGADVSRTEILIGVFYHLFGKAGEIAIGVAIALACLTTSIGLTAVAGNFFSNAFKGKVSYKTVVFICIGVSFVLSLLGVEGLIKLAVPILSAIYPVIIVLIVLTLFDKFIKYNLLYTGAVVGAFLVSGPMGLNMMVQMNTGHGIGIIDRYIELLNGLPLASVGFPWIIPTIVAAVIFTVIGIALPNSKTRVNTEVVEG